MAVAALPDGVVQKASTLTHSRKPDNPAKIRDAASQFEALLINQMMQSSRASSGGWMGGEEDQNSTLTELGEQQFAQALASNGGLGIAKMIIAGLNHHENR